MNIGDRGTVIKVSAKGYGGIDLLEYPSSSSEDDGLTHEGSNFKLIYRDQSHFPIY
jgi:hypothetical protein